MLPYNYGGTPQSSVVLTSDEVKKQYDDQLARANAMNASGQDLYQKAIGEIWKTYDPGLAPEQRYANAQSLVDAALGGNAGQFSHADIPGLDSLPNAYGGVQSSFIQSQIGERGGSAWNALNSWAPVDTSKIEADQKAALDKFSQNQKTQNQAYDMMQGGGFNGGVLSGGATTSMFGTPMVGGLGGLGGYNPSGGFGMPGSQQSTQSYADDWGKGAFGQPQGAQSGGLGGPFSSVKNPWSFS